MIRFVILFSVLAAPLAAQTALNDRPGRWLSVPRAEAPVLQAPADTTPVLEAPAAGALITGAPAPAVVLETPEAVTEIVLIVPEVQRPDTRPVPRPTPPAAILAEATGPDAAPLNADPGIEEVLAALLAPAAEAPALEAPQPAPVVEVARLVPANRPAPEVAALGAPVTPLAPAARVNPAALVGEVDALPRVSGSVPYHEAVPEDAVPAVAEDDTGVTVTVALAEALAAQIAAEAHAITVAAPRVVPRAEDISPEVALAPVRPMTIPVVAARMPAPAAEPAPAAPVAPARVLVAPQVVPRLTAAFTAASQPGLPMPMSAVLLPASAGPARPVVQPVAFLAPQRETVPILPRSRPMWPAAQDGIAALPLAHTAPLSAVLLPTLARQFAPVPRMARSPAPSRDRFPLSALPPSALPEGPYSLRRTIQPPRPFAEANAAVLTGMAMVIPARMPVLLPSTAPAVDLPVTDPDAAVALPAPDARALARVMEDAAICWRLADLTVEAQWARLSVDVALDETNMPSAQSIRLTGFAHVVSGAAENAYRAAHGALVGCAEATGAEPATAAATLVFDRNGVRLR